ncbi:MAG: RNA recognition motif domain-containing protein [Akkermansia muciniphila]
MAEHHTQGRQGQGARRRRYNSNKRRHRMPRPEPAPAKKPSLLRRILSFFGIGKKKDELKKNLNKDAAGSDKQTPKQRVRIAKSAQNRAAGNPAAPRKRRPNSTPPTQNGRLYVGNLSFEATEAELEDLFKGFGNVRSVEVIYNPRTYKSKGYAFVEMCRTEDARRAAEILHGQPFMGREMMVSAASERREKPEETEQAPAPAAEPTPAPETTAASSPEA